MKLTVSIDSDQFSTDLTEGQIAGLSFLVNTFNNGNPNPATAADFLGGNVVGVIDAGQANRLRLRFGAGDQRFLVLSDLEGAKVTAIMQIPDEWPKSGQDPLPPYVPPSV